ncbi:MAG TPA: ABC transporter permease [Thermoanaerobaculia bacterium]|nr:ABC transporter permease [Thermoanaerobaculia bacterium]
MNRGRVAGAPAILLAGGAVALFWEIAARRAGGAAAIFFPPPSAILAATVRRFADGGLSRAAATTAARVLVGVGLAAPVGIGLGALAGWSPAVRRTLDPLLAAGHAVPKIAALPLFLVAFGIGESARILLVAVSAFFPLAINTIAGVAEISPVHFEVARHYGASRARTFGRVVLPGALPLVLVGLRLALTLGLVIAIALELVAANDGLGAWIWRAWQTFSIDDLWAGLLTASLFGIAIQAGLELASRRLVRWRRARIE